MGYIVPNSDIVLLHNIKLDSAYENTIYFESKAAQEAYFFNSSKILLHLTRHSYNRTIKNSVKVKVPVGTVEQCTYLAFKNTSYENKWFYCFVDDFNYINDNTTEILYHIDYVQTYFIGECELLQCYVEREHDPTDIVGQNRVPEPISSDHLRYTLKWECQSMKDVSVVVSASLKESVTPTYEDGYQQGMFNGLEVKHYPITEPYDAADILALLQDMLGDGNYIDPTTGVTDRQQVVSLIMFPTAYCQEDEYGNPFSTEEGHITKTRTNVDGYVPKNNKLFTAPFKSLLLTNSVGGGVTLDYDDFVNTNEVNFKVWGVCSGSGEMCCLPLNYKGLVNNFDFKLMLNGFPQCAYTIDSYRAWVAGGGDKYMKMGLVQGIAGGVKDAIQTGWSILKGEMQKSFDFENAINTPNPNMINYNLRRSEQRGEMIDTENAQKVGSSANTFANAGVKYMEQKFESGNMVNVPVGENSASCLFATRDMTFKCYELNIVAEDAERIDNFFSLYGYATNKLKVPNINARPQWNYVKTKGCTIGGNVPSTIRSMIEQIFDNGIRFWKNGDNIGNYNLVNK